ncbi:hypothetical protein ILUMI_11699 [Ignelater luminosus]|uniref:CCHC-type domain-containing protein n=1 Tax=Ignelater luminosus TaxID=2038154 RepID=A0A8K0CXZ5_IGNLU|nr:hypothetical protein ILUMI_11699 [Ignelater luminosus]
MSTLSTEYFEFKSMWESVPLDEKMINYLTKRLHLIEMRISDNKNELTALLVVTYKHNSERYANEKEAEKCFTCFKCYKFGHFAKQCGKKPGDAPSSTAKFTKPTEEAFVSISGVDVDQSETWIANLCASAHMAMHKDYVLTYESFSVPKEIKVRNGEVEEEFCEGSVLEKQHRASFRDRKDKSAAVGKLIHTDVCGPMQNISLDGTKYFVCLKDNQSKFRRHPQPDILTVKKILCDEGKEFDNANVKAALSEKGIDLRVTMP